MARKIQLARAKHLLQAYHDAEQKRLEVAQGRNFAVGRSHGAEWRRWLRNPSSGIPRVRTNEPLSRQALRAQLRTKRYAEIRIAGDRHRFPKDAQPLPRRERRALARAYAARDYAEARNAKK